MPKTTLTANETLDAILRAVDPSWRSGANRYIAIYTASPTTAGTAVSNECAYGSYARVAVVANTGFTAGASGSSENTGLLQFPICTSGSETVTYVGIVTTASGAGQLLYFGELTSPRSVSSGIQPQFAISALTVTES